MVKCLPKMWETRVQSLSREDLLEKKVATHSVFLPGKSHGRRNLVGYSPWGLKESDMTEQLHFHFWEKQEWDSTGREAGRAVRASRMQFQEAECGDGRPQSEGKLLLTSPVESREAGKDCCLLSPRRQRVSITSVAPSAHEVWRIVPDAFRGHLLEIWQSLRKNSPWLSGSHQAPLKRDESVNWWLCQKTDLQIQDPMLFSVATASTRIEIKITNFFLELLDFIYNITSSFIKHVTKNFLLLLLIYGGASCKEPAWNAGDLRDIGSIPGLGRSPGDGHGNPFQCSCLENPIDKGDWRAMVHTVAESDTTKVT